MAARSPAAANRSPRSTPSPRRRPRPRGRHRRRGESPRRRGRLRRVRSPPRRSSPAWSPPARDRARRRALDRHEHGRPRGGPRAGRPARRGRPRALDVPVTGGVARARTGELTLFAGGPEADVEAARPVLERLGTVHVSATSRGRPGDQGREPAPRLGPHRRGRRGARARREARPRPRDRLGLLERGAAGSWMLSDRGPRMLEGTDVGVTSSIGIFVKDSGLVASAPRRRARLPLLEFARERTSRPPRRGSPPATTRASSRPTGGDRPGRPTTSTPRFFRPPIRSLRTVLSQTVDEDRGPGRRPRRPPSPPPPMLPVAASLGRRPAGRRPGRGRRGLPAARSRAIDEQAAVALYQQIRGEIDAAAERLGEPVQVVPGDSTLRGRVFALRDVFVDDEPILFLPAFPAGGRVTVGGVHYVEVDGERVPAHETEYARDPVFGFGHGGLGRLRAGTRRRPAAAVALDILRVRGPRAVTNNAPAGRSGRRRGHPGRGDRRGHPPGARGSKGDPGPWMAGPWCAARPPLAARCAGVATTVCCRRRWPAASQSARRLQNFAAASGPPPSSPSCTAGPHHRPGRRRRRGAGRQHGRRARGGRRSPGGNWPTAASR